MAGNKIKTRSIHITKVEVRKAAQTLSNPKASKTAKSDAAIILNELKKVKK